MAGVNFTTYDKYFKDKYIDCGKKDAMIFEDQWLKIVKNYMKSGPVEGKQVVIPYELGRSPSVSRDFGVAQAIAKKKAAAIGSWTIPLDDAYGVGRVDEKTMRASRNNEGAFQKALEKEVKNAIVAMQHIRCQDFFAPKPNHKGATKNVGDGSTKLITLTNAWQAANFDRGDEIRFYDDLNKTAPVERGLKADGPYSVEKVDLVGGTITLDKAPKAAILANSEIARDGDAGKVAMASLNKWIPKTLAKVSTDQDATLFGQDRTINPLRLQGSRRQVAANGSVVDAVTGVAAQIAAICKTTGPNIALMHPMTKRYISNQTNSNIRYSRSDGTGGGGVVRTNNGNFKFVKFNDEFIEPVTTPFADPGVIWLIDTKYIALYFLPSPQNGEFVDFIYQNGSMFKQSHDEPGVEIRTASFCNFVLPYPGTCGRVDLNSSNVPKYT